MGKLSDAMDRIKAKKQQHSDLADGWNARLNAVDKREAEVTPLVESVITSHETDLAEVEETVRAMSNFPTEGSAKSPKAPSPTAALGEGTKMAIAGPFVAPPVAPMPKAPQLINPSTGDPLK